MKKVPYLELWFVAEKYIKDSPNYFYFYSDLLMTKHDDYIIQDFSSKHSDKKRPFLAEIHFLCSGQIGYIF